MKSVAIVIPVYNRIKITKRGIDALERSLALYDLNGSGTCKFTIVVIDDGSKDGTSEELANNYSKVVVLNGDGNLWWSGAINLGVSYALDNAFDSILLWNDDTISAEGYFVELEKAILDVTYKNSIIVSKIFWQDAPDTLFNFGCRFDPKTGKTIIIGLNDKDGPDYQKPTEIDWSGGMGTLIPLDVIRDIGKFDNINFPQYFGDADFFLRAKQFGYKIYAMPGLHVWNDREATGSSLKSPYLKSYIDCLVSIRSQFNVKQNLLFIKRHAKGSRPYFNIGLFYINFTKQLVKKILRLSYLKDLMLSLRLVFFNHFINRIPFNFIRIPLMRMYIKIGKNSNVMNGVIIYNKLIDKGQIEIGDNCVINRDCLLDGRIGKLVIGNNVDIARGTWIFTLEHDVHANNHHYNSGDVIIEDHVWIASRVTILPGVKLSKGCVVAAGAVVTKNVPELKIAGGVPAKIIGDRRSDLSYTLKHFPFFSY
ncbi:glycosyltransferase [Mucilaginibacter myungsuensis]|uniref:Glycosyltransferase n=1 Tax=Mucilaginibacter myungsuensis TaxID=649104 RepID=A0A929KWE5_9SPHI|nr:glycosyltransferase [Mucilaginibacter myungsuensis]MBE9662412.1 glycosyltransferase [Mucilaginibacter myungsuensis]MDN3599151.1 glycosyltransferase [Mucilaginibacter myungsuensis]